MSRLGVAFAERVSQSRRGRPRAALGRSMLHWACLFALAYLALRFICVRL